MKYRVGIDIGGTKIAYGLFDENKKLVAKQRTQTDVKLDAERFFDKVCEEMLAFLDMRNVMISEVAGIGIGMPSFIDFDNGYVIRTGSLPQIQNFSLKAYLHRILGKNMNIVIDNDGNTGALAELNHGAGREYQHMIFCLVSTGIGSSIIINRSLFRGSFGCAGESGHMLVKSAETTMPLCGCNNVGCLNSLCSGKMILNHVRKWIKNGDKTNLVNLAGSLDAIDTECISQAYELGDPLAIRAVEQMAEYIAIWLYNMYLMLNINCFVFSGGLLAMGDKLFGSIRRKFDQYNKSSYPVFFLNTQLGDDTGIIGAMELLYLT